MTNAKLAYSFNDDLKNKSDDELIMLARNKNEEALEVILDRYKELVNIKVSKCNVGYLNPRYTYIIPHVVKPLFK